MKTIHIRTCFVYGGGGAVQAGSGDGKLQCREPKTGQQKQKVPVYYEDDPRCPPRDVIYLWHTWSS